MISGELCCVEVVLSMIVKTGCSRLLWSLKVDSGEEVMSQTWCGVVGDSLFLVGEESVVTSD